MKIQEALDRMFVGDITTVLDAADQNLLFGLAVACMRKVVQYSEYSHGLTAAQAQQITGYGHIDTVRHGLLCHYMYCEYRKGARIWTDTTSDGKTHDEDLLRRGVYEAYICLYPVRRRAPRHVLEAQAKIREQYGIR